VCTCLRKGGAAAAAHLLLVPPAAAALGTLALLSQEAPAQVTQGQLMLPNEHSIQPRVGQAHRHVSGAGIH